MIRWISRVALLIAVFGSDAHGAKTSATPLTFNKDVAPILFRACVSCHHPGGSAPFSLTTFDEVRKRSKLISQLVENRTMPPWLPEPGPHFAGDRRLADDEIATIISWCRSKRLQGATVDLPKLPDLPSDWQLGPPDLVIEMPEPYKLPASGADTYRNFVIPKVSDSNRYIRAVEFRPGDTKAIHHAFILTDTTGEARRLDGRDKDPGFPGMVAGRGARVPGGFMSWQPGRAPVESPEGMSWLLAKESDVVLQLHLRPTGKPETIHPKLGLYFTDKAPSRPYMIMLLRSASIEISPGNRDYTIESSYQLTVDTSLIGLLPHMHYLGRSATAWAELPDGTHRDLITINRWDFSWQSDYRYSEPLALPKGTTIRMRYVYDNSVDNPRNPNHPPATVRYGLQSSDEMGELWLWLETKSTEDLVTLQRGYFGTYGLQDRLAQNEAMLRQDPKDAESRTELGVTYMAMGRKVDAVTELRQAITDNPKIQRAQYVLGTLLYQMGDLPGGEAALTKAVELDPSDSRAQNNLAIILLNRGKTIQAIQHYQKALLLDPSDALARQGLEKAKSMLQVVPMATTPQLGKP